MNLRCILIECIFLVFSVNSFSIHSNLPNIANRRAFLDSSASAVATIALIGGKPSTAYAASENAVISAGGSIRFGDEDIMSPKAHGTTVTTVQENLRFGVSPKLADKICSFNRHFAENSFSFTKSTWEEELRQVVATGKSMTFYDSVTGKPLFVAPIGRSVNEFMDESYKHGWPSFRDAEVVWDNVRVLKNSGETVSVDGTHLGHNLPDRSGNRYCINLCCIAGNPMA